MRVVRCAVFVVGCALIVACCVLLVYGLPFVGVCHRLLHVVCSLVRSMFGLGCLCLVC